MDVISYRNGFSKDDINILKEDVLKVIQHTEEEIPFDDQMLFWLDKDAKPKNMIEKYILNAYQMISKNEGEIEDLAGFEWWVHHSKPDEFREEIQSDEYICLHIDRDENHYMLTRELIKPKRATILYLTTIDDAPTVIADAKSDYNDSNPKNIDKEFNNLVFSFPEEGKLTTFDGQYMHGAMHELLPDSERLVIMVNYWNYKLDDGKEEEIFSMLDKFDCEEDRETLWYPPKVECLYESETNLLELTNEETIHYTESTVINDSKKFKTILYIDKNNKYEFETEQPIQRPKEVVPMINYNQRLDTIQDG